MTGVVVLAHVGGLHAVLYLSPVLIVIGGLWFAGRHVTDDDLEFEDDEPS